MSDEFPDRWGNWIQGGLFNATLADKKRTGWRRFNGGQECDMDKGPCSCGAWHDLEEERVKRSPIWKDSEVVS